MVTVITEPCHHSEELMVGFFPCWIRIKRAGLYLPAFHFSNILFLSSPIFFSFLKAESQKVFSASCLTGSTCVHFRKVFKILANYLLLFSRSIRNSIHLNILVPPKKLRINKW